MNEAYFGQYGGRFVPESLVPACDNLARAFEDAWSDETFRSELNSLLTHYVGRPTPITHAKSLSAETGLRVLLKREDLAHTGSHKINNVLGQALLAKRMGKSRLIAETGAGQHGVATATAAALLDLDCTVYMGSIDVARQALNVFRMELLGAMVIPVESGAKTLKDAVNEAMREWVSSEENSHYCLGSVMGPHPFPTMVRELQSVISEESKRQMLDDYAQLPDAVIACVGGGSNAAGSFSRYLATDVRLIGVEAQGGAALANGRPGVVHGSRSYLLQDEFGQVAEAHSISAGLDYPGVGPEHAFWKDSGRVGYVNVNDDEVLDAFVRVAKAEGLLVALESAHALAWVLNNASEMLEPGSTVLVTVSGRGDKDVAHVKDLLGR